ncbi:MAG: primase C-terminal domain-containing protein, partial [Pontimonas sp.]
MSATNYLQAVPPPHNGSRNATLNTTAYQIRERFPELDQMDFEVTLLEWCRSWPSPLPESEAMKTIRSAWRGAQSKGAVGAKQRTYNGPPRAQGYQTPQRPYCPPQAAPAVKAVTYAEPSSRVLPCPIEDGTRKLLKAAFEPGEGIRIAGASLNEDGREVPSNEGAVLSLEEWTRKLDVYDGDPNCLFSSSQRTGIYITINPMRCGGAKDADVTKYRHALLEFDEISREE